MRTASPASAKRLGEKGAAFEEKRRERAAGIGALGIGNFGKRHHIRP